MKTKVTLLLVFFIVGLAYFSLGQKPHENPKFGEDSVSRMECVKNISLFREFIKQKNYLDASKPWRYVFVSCPAATKNTYIDGAKILKWLIKNETNEARKDELLDTLMFMYDQRIKYFKQEGSVLGRKASDLLRTKPSKYEEAHKYLERSCDILGKKTDAVVLLLLMQTSKSKYLSGTLDKEEVVGNFTKAIDILDYQLKHYPKKKTKIVTGKENVEKVFLSMEGVATCDAITSFYQPKFEETPENIALLKSIIAILEKIDCANTNLFYGASENLHNIEPSAESAYAVGKMFKEKKNYQKASKYYKQAIELQTDNILKAKYYIELGDLTYRHFNNPNLARSYAFKAIETDNTNGHPYILLGNIYATCKDCGENDFEKKAVYWLAVDMYTKAKKVDSTLSADANKFISLYSQYFPDTETIFFHGKKEGESFTIECWINENTTIRAR